MIHHTVLKAASIICFLSLSIPSVQAQTVNNSQELAVDQLPPQKLIKLARHGRFKAQGIPGYSKLNSSIRSGKVDAQVLVTAAIKQNRLPETALQDASYLSAINDHLKSGGCGTL